MGSKARSVESKLRRMGVKNFRAFRGYNERSENGQETKKLLRDINAFVSVLFGSYAALRSDSSRLSVFTARRYASAISCHRVSVCLSVCLSVRLSVTSLSCTKMAKPRIRLTTPYDSPETLVFRDKNVGEIPTTSPPTGAPNRGG